MSLPLLLIAAAAVVLWWPSLLRLAKPLALPPLPSLPVANGTGRALVRRGG